ncbi:hypothetical protein ADIARSV_4027 [Arcticibacter svalbardensis MN12-7]|uniref:Uncharacterized protein n=1 Tax=Arcticibacter svalbardensis MN12-7 TaxID=1150600 RepID=R9GM95_9SPHI|nr:hypothetical protein [Arcticibacter svalbardensis]EOR92816.1 hypothetical protein ADIARSV_4027 [Arcticibacter svalbardensis MN12-7]
MELWKIVVAHHPLYTGGNRADGYDTKAIRNSLNRYYINIKLTFTFLDMNITCNTLFPKKGK